MERNTPIPVIPIADLRRGKSLPAAQPQAGALVDMFNKNFAKFEAYVSEGVKKAAPKA